MKLKRLKTPEPWEQKRRWKMHNNRPQMLMAGPLILHDNARPHTAEDFAIMDGMCYLMRPTVQTLVHQISTYFQG